MNKFKIFTVLLMCAIVQIAWAQSVNKAQLDQLKQDLK